MALVGPHANSYAYPPPPSPHPTATRPPRALSGKVDQYCATGPTAAPTGAAFIVTEGTEYCMVTEDGLCITDGPGNYSVSEQCTTDSDWIFWIFWI